MLMIFLKIKILGKNLSGLNPIGNKSFFFPIKKKKLTKALLCRRSANDARRLSARRKTWGDELGVVGAVSALDSLLFVDNSLIILPFDVFRRESTDTVVG